MPGRHSAKQKRQAKHIAESERKRGVDPKRAESIGWATVNKQKGVSKGPGDFKPTPIASRTSGGPKKPVGLDIGPVTVEPVKKPVSLDIGKVTVAPAPKPVGLDIGKVTVSPVPKPSTAPSAPRVASKSYAAMGKADPLERQFKEMTDKLKRRAGRTRKRPFGRRGITAFGKGGEAALPRPKTEWATPRENMSRMSYGSRKKHKEGFIARHKMGIKDLGTITVSAKEKSMGKSLKVLSISDYYDSVMKAEGGAPPAGGAPAPGAVKKFPRKLKPTVKMKPISDSEAVANLKAGKYHEKSLVMLAAIKALVSGYGKVSGGGALRAPNRGFPTVGDLQRAMEAMPKPSGPLPPATTYLPGVHGPEVKQRAAKMRAKTSKRVAAKAEMPDQANMLSSMEEPTLKKRKNVVHKSEGAASMSKTNFNDLFKSELGIANDEVLVDCPHCESPITKSDLAKAHKGKGAVTHVSGPHEVEADAHVVKQNPHGGTMRGGEGRGVLTSSRGVPGAKKTDAVAGVQNSKGSKAHKAMDGSSSCDDDSSSNDSSSYKKGDGPQVPAYTPMPKKTSDAGSQGRVSMRGVAQAQSEAKAPAPAPKPPQVAQKSIRGTEFVQYIDYGDAPGSDASIAKSIAEAQGALGQQATQPMDLNNDLSRLLV